MSINVHLPMLVAWDCYANLRVLRKFGYNPFLLLWVDLSPMARYSSDPPELSWRVLTLACTPPSDVIVLSAVLTVQCKASPTLVLAMRKRIVIASLAEMWLGGAGKPLSLVSSCPHVG